MLRPLSFCLLGVFLAVSFVAGQDRDRDGGDGDRDGDRSRYRGSWDPAERLRQMDANGDGKLEKSEVSERFWPYIERRLRDAGMDTDKPIAIDTYVELMQRRDDDDRRRDDDDDQRRDDDDRRRDSGSSSQADVRLVPGFGVDLQLSPVPGFGLDTIDGTKQVRGRGVPLEDRYHERILGYVDGIIRRYDRNENKVLEQDEWKNGRWRNPPPEESDRNKDGRLSREELCERVQGYEEFRSLANSSGSSSSSSSGSSSDRLKFENYAKALLSRYDSNKNGVLDENEWQRMSKYHQGADANGDKQITRSELTDRLVAYSREEGYRGGSSGSGRSDDDGQSYRVTGSGTAYKVRSAADRLPKGLPSWFAEKDENEDGQIAMAEYTNGRSDDAIEEFQGYDANNDGIITPDECLAGPTSKPASSSASTSSSKSSSDSPSSSRYSRPSSRYGRGR